MKTEEEIIETCDAPVIVQQRIDPEVLWLDLDVSGEDLIELDPLEEDDVREILADEGLGIKRLLRCLRPYSDDVWEKVWPILKTGLQRQHNSVESPVDFQERLKGAA